MRLKFLACSARTQKSTKWRFSRLNRQNFEFFLPSSLVTFSYRLGLHINPRAENISCLGSEKYHMYVLPYLLFKKLYQVKSWKSVFGFWFLGIFLYSIGYLELKCRWQRRNVTKTTTVHYFMLIVPYMQIEPFFRHVASWFIFNCKVWRPVTSGGEVACDFLMLISLHTQNFLHILAEDDGL